MDDLIDILKNFIRITASKGYIGLLYSGGIDSSIIGKILGDIYHPSTIMAGSVGLRKSHDIINAAKGASELKINFVPQILDLDILSKTLSQLKKMNFIQNPVHLSVAIPMYLAIKKLKEEYAIESIFLGQGADELFGGYNRYILEIEKTGFKFLNKMMMDDLDTLIQEQLPMERVIAKKLDVKLHYPYLDQKVITYAHSFQVTQHIIITQNDEIIRKALLRKLAEKIGLTREIYLQQKKAIQYGSGTVRLLRRYAKQEGYPSIREWFRGSFQQN